MDGGSFQKLADCYLYKKGYEKLEPTGSVIGTNKVRKGRPDSYVRRDSGKLVFAEFTTEQNHIRNKLKSDLADCLDPSKTGVALSDLDEIVLCHTSSLPATDEQELINIGKEQSKKVTIFGIGNFSFDLCEKYPGLAEDFLGISIDTRQILEPSDFIIRYGRNQLTTTLDTEFLFREEETRTILDQLEHCDLIILSGPAGVGKSRLALKVLNDFTTFHPTFKSSCIYNLGPDLHNDIRVHFSAPGSFLILADDANRLSTFDYIVNLVQHQRSDQNIKVIATVRDYARDKITHTAKQLKHMTEIELSPMNAEQIEGLVRTECKITNKLVLDRITDITRGNPRLAIMAAKVAVEQNSLASINDVTMLYEQYFGSVLDDLNGLDNHDILKTAAIISFFRTVDRTDTRQMKSIEDHLNIGANDFWDHVNFLHRSEIVDIHENNVAKMSDQVFSSYLFYLCIFKKKIVEFDFLVENFFPQKANLLMEAIFPCLSAFNVTFLRTQMRQSVQKKWQKLRESNQDENINKFIHLFWFMIQTETLAYVSQRIRLIEPRVVDWSDIDWSAENPDQSEHPLLNLLALFHQADDEATFRRALELVFRYFERQPHAAPHIIEVLTDRFGFRRFSHLQEYRFQKTVVEVLWKKTDEGVHPLYSRLFLAITERYFPTEFTNHESSKRDIRIYNFQLQPIEPVFELREVLWKGVFLIFQNPNLQAQALEVLRSYARSGYHLSERNIVFKDAEQIIPFIREMLDPGNFAHCVFVHDYAKRLLHRDASVDPGFLERFSSQVYRVFELLSFDYVDADDMSFREFENYKQRRIEEYTNSFGLTDFEELFIQCSLIISAVNDDHQIHEIKLSLISALLFLSERSPCVFVEVIERYLKLGNPLELSQAIPIVKKVMEICGAQRTLSIIEEADFRQKHAWLFGFYMVLPPGDIDRQRVEGLYQLYRSAQRGELPYDVDYLIKFDDHQNGVIINISKIIIEKAAEDPWFGHDFDGLFNNDSETNKRIFEFFENQEDLLEVIYFVHKGVYKKADYRGHMLGRILSRNPEFIRTIVKRVNDDSADPPAQDWQMDYSFLWRRDDFENLILIAFDEILKQVKSSGIFRYSYLEHLFCVNAGRGCPEDIKGRQDEFLKSLIQEYSKDKEAIMLCFSVISNFEAKRRPQFFETFLELNQDFSMFERLPFEPDVWSWSGSAVPIYQSRIEFWESLLALCDDVELLEHRLFIEQQILSRRESMEAEKKSDFKDDDRWLNDE